MGRLADADQAGHRLHIAFVPTGAAEFQTQAQCFCFSFDLAAANDLASFETFKVIEPVRVFDEVTDQTVCCFAATLLFLFVRYIEQFAYPLSDALPSPPQ